MKLFRTLTAALLAALIAVSAAAAFTPSVEFKEAPTVVEKTDAAGNTYVGEVKNSEGEVVGTVSNGTLKLTALSTVKQETAEKETEEDAPAAAVVDETVKERLLKAETELKAAFEDGEDSYLLQQISKELNDAPVENIVISDIFHIEATEEISSMLEENAVISVSVVSQNITKADEELIVIYQKTSENGGWKKVEFTIDDENVITLELQGMGDIIILRDSEALPPVAEEAPASPSTSGNTKNTTVTKKPIIKRAK